MTLQTLKGFRDFLPSEAKKRQYVIDILRKTFESYGFEPLETPALEYEEVLAGKYGEEGQKLMYRFRDQGGRDVALRYDQTVPLARVVAQYQNDILLPFKRYQIQNVWRAENTQKGRYREFLQCDIDTVGTPNLFADAEAIAVIAKALENLGVKDYKVLINDRRIFQELIRNKLIDESSLVLVLRAIDKINKIGEQGVLDELGKLGIDENQRKLILNTINNLLPDDEFKKIFDYLKEMGIEENKFEFSPSLARGLDYYTGMIFEVEIEGYDVGSVAGGGRYDNLIGMFGNKPVPAVGGSFGFDRLIEALESLDLFPKDLQTAKVLITSSQDNIQKALDAAKNLRSNKINVEIYPDNEAPIDKQLKYADKKQIPFVVLFEGEKTVLKDMTTGEKSEPSLEEISKKIVL